MERILTAYELAVLQAIGARLRRARLAKAWTLRVLSDRITQAGQFTISHQTLAHIEAGQRGTSLPKLLHVAELLDIPELTALLPQVLPSLRSTLVGLLSELDEPFLRGLLSLIQAHRQSQRRPSLPVLKRLYGYADSSATCDA